MNNALRSFVAITAGLIMSCSNSQPEGQIEIHAPETGKARIAVSAKIDWDRLSNSSFAQRVVIDEIRVNIAELKLLGDNPTMRVDGEPLIEAATLMTVSNNTSPREFPVAEQFRSERLSVYARVAPSDALANSSVVVRARLYESQENTFEQSLSSSQEDDDNKPSDNDLNTNYETHETPNPDSEPNRDETPNPDGEPNRDETPNPDGEPNREETPNPDGEPNREESPNPDGEPNTEGDEDQIRRSGLSAGSTDKLFGRKTYVPFELRGADVIEMVALLEATSQKDVTLSIPAHKWLTTEALHRLEAALAFSLEKTSKARAGENRERTRRVIVLDSNDEAARELSDNRNELFRFNEDYRLLTEGPIDPKKKPGKR